MDKVDAWLRENGRSRYWLAQQIGVSRGLLTLIAQDKRSLTADVARSIKAVTGISLDDLLGAA